VHIIYLLTYLFIYSFIHSFTHSFIHLFTHSLTHSLTHSFIHSFIHSLTHSLTHSFIHSSIHLFIYLFIMWAGSPWRVDVMNPAQITVVGAGSQLIPVNVPAWFEIRGAVACEDGELVVNITCKSANISLIFICQENSTCTAFRKQSLVPIFRK